MNNERIHLSTPLPAVQPLTTPARHPRSPSPLTNLRSPSLLTAGMVTVAILAAFGMAGPNENNAGWFGYLCVFIALCPGQIFFGYTLGYTTNSLEVVEQVLRIVGPEVELQKQHQLWSK